MDSPKTGGENKAKGHEWHALPVPKVFEYLVSDEKGLTEENVLKRREKHGFNEFTQTKKETYLGRVIGQLKSPLTVVLILAFIVTIALGEFVDATVIALALLVAVVVGVLQEGKASRAFEKLANSQVQHAMVVRNGKKHEIEARELVPGDVVMVQGGMQVPADIRITSAKKLTINEAALTGEWMAVDKGKTRVDVGTPFADQSSVAHMGTFVASGYGTGVVVATGDDTAIGKLAGELDAIEDSLTPIQLEMAKVSKVMLWIIVTLVVVIFLLGILRGESTEVMLLTAIAIAVAAVPEGLPAAVTIILAVGMEALLKRGGLVRNLLAAETLGSTTYILTDKTGTLTQARMAITEVSYIDCLKEEDAQTCDWVDDAVAKQIFDIALCASDAYLDEKRDENDSYVVRGEPMERAILESAQELGLTLQGDSARGHRIDFLAFESENRFALGLTRYGEKYRLCINGAPETLLASATHVFSGTGKGEMTKKMREHFESEIEKHTKLGRRLIAIAYKDVKYDDIPEDLEGVIDDSVFVGILIIDDPLREDVAEAIKGVLGAGAEIRLVTGDNPLTALSIARAVGIAREHDVALTGDELSELNDEELLEVIKTTRVFARVLPKQKLRLAQVLQKDGQVVAMTGDGINDAPALRRANIGVAIGSGTEVAKESSDLVLVKDSFSTIYAAIEEGRRITGNLRKVVGYLLSTSLSEAVLIAGALITGGVIPILPAQILWANIIEEGLMSVAFAFEKGDKNAMKEKPQDIHEEGILSKDMLMFSGFIVVILSVLLLALYMYLRLIDVSTETLRSVMFLAISLDSLFIAFSFRSLKTPVWKIPLKTNIFFIVSFLTSFTLLMIVLSVPFLQFVFSYQPLPWFFIALTLAYGISTMIFAEIAKWFFFRPRNET